MEKNINTLVIPDVHGRDFWKEPVMETLNNNPEAKIIFLGDYIDPYLEEFDAKQPYFGYDEEKSKKAREVRNKTYEQFLEIIELKKQYPDRITLIIGNHDLGSLYSSDICDCRRDFEHRNEYMHIGNENWNLFQLADEITVNNKHIIFSHAGIHKAYAEHCFGEEVNEDNVVQLFNKHFLDKNYGIMDSLGIYSNYRGYSLFEYGSIVWADAREWLKEKDGETIFEESYCFQIFGHTRLNDEFIGKPLATEYFAMIDCRAVFYVDETGKLRRYSDSEVIDKKNY